MSPSSARDSILTCIREKRAVTGSITEFLVDSPKGGVAIQVSASDAGRIRPCPSGSPNRATVWAAFESRMPVLGHEHVRQSKPDQTRTRNRANWSKQEPRTQDPDRFRESKPAHNRTQPDRMRRSKPEQGASACKRL